MGVALEGMKRRGDGPMVVPRSIQSQAHTWFGYVR
jgi:hypothetical protein